MASSDSDRAFTDSIFTDSIGTDMTFSSSEWTSNTVYILLTLLSMYTLYRLISAWKPSSRLKTVPKALVLPLIGDTTRLFHDGPPLARQRFGKLGPVWETWVLGQKTIIVGRGDMIKWCLNREHDLLEANWPTSTKVLLGRYAVVRVEGERHLQLRKILRPAFTVAAVNELIPRMASIVRRCCDRWASVGHGKGLLFAKEFTFSIALELILGFDETLLTAATIQSCTDAFSVWNEGLFSFPVNVPGTAFYKALKAKKVLMGYLYQNLELLREKKQRGAESGEQVSCAEGLLDIKDDEGNGLIQEELMDLYLTMLFAGHDTSASATMRLFSELSRHPNVWNKLIAEQQQVAAEHGPDIDGEAVKAMTYTDAVVKEILRLHPIAGGVFRRALHDFDLFGYHIPKGRTVFLNIGYAMEADERWAAEAGERAPRSFCPERWLDEEGHKTGAWMPFGGGPRLCLGYLLATAELKVLLAVLARGYEWRPVDVNEHFSFFPVGGHPVNGLPMDFFKLPMLRTEQ